MAPAWLAELLLIPELDIWRTHALAFLLGSYVVATLSDLRYLSAQREFPEVWGFFAAVILGLDLWQEWPPGAATYVKWGLILALGLASWERAGWLFRLAPADVFAMVATAALLPPVLVVAYWALAWVLSKVMRVLLSRGGAWPFMPVVTVASLGVLLGYSFRLLP